jgi:DNA-binding transcriptional regulator PaaX
MDKAWNIPEIIDDLAKFIKDAEWSLKAMGKGNGDRYNAKKLIFEYATIIKKGPLLPEEFLEKSEVRKAAHEIYLKLRKYAV